MAAAAAIAGTRAAGSQLTPEDFVRIAQQAIRNQVSNDSVGVQAAQAAIQSPVAVVFIPGLLGSELQRPGGDVIWGEGDAVARNLRLNQDDGINRPPSVQAKVLLQYDPRKLKLRPDWKLPARSITRIFAPESDVYQTSLRLLQTASGVRERERLDFAYDWRQDIGLLAARLDQHLSQAHFRNKSIVLIAHSMGGVVASHWLAQHYNRDGTKEPRVRRLMLLGAPLKGSCELLRVLREGPKFAGAGLEAVFEALFLRNDLRAAAFTFPSVFELVPSGSCLEICDSSAPQACIGADVLDPVFWKDAFGEEILKGAPSTVGMEATDFKQRFESVLATARRFRELGDASYARRARTVVNYFYSTGVHTLERVRVPATADRFERRHFQLTTDGDGRVTKVSAMNGQDPASPAGAIELCSIHGDLPNDPEFRAYLRSGLSGSKSAEQTVALAHLINRDPDLFDAFVKEGGAPICEEEVALRLSWVSSRNQAEERDALPGIEEIAKLNKALQELPAGHLQGRQADSLAGDIAKSEKLADDGKTTEAADLAEKAVERLRTNACRIPELIKALLALGHARVGRAQSYQALREMNSLAREEERARAAFREAIDLDANATLRRNLTPRVTQQVFDEVRVEAAQRKPEQQGLQLGCARVADGRLELRGRSLEQSATPWVESARPAESTRIRFDSETRTLSVSLPQYQGPMLLPTRVKVLVTQNGKGSNTVEFDYPSASWPGCVSAGFFTGLSVLRPLSFDREPRLGKGAIPGSLHFVVPFTTGRCQPRIPNRVLRDFHPRGMGFLASLKARTGLFLGMAPAPRLAGPGFMFGASIRLTDRVGLVVGKRVRWPADPAKESARLVIGLGFEPWRLQVGR